MTALGNPTKEQIGTIINTLKEKNHGYSRSEVTGAGVEMLVGYDKLATRP